MNMKMDMNMNIDRFRRLGIDEPILRAIEKEGFEEPSEIQQKATPLVLKGHDVIAGSATGSGKTLVFGAGLIHNTEPGKGIQSLILTPTRELAEQVTRSLRLFSRHKRLEVVSVYGGVSINPQIQSLGGADVVVGTPGRILDHLERRTIYLGNVNTLVLDEADRMLDMGFIEDVERIIMACPRERQTLLFSATITYSVSMLAEKYTRNPKSVSAEVYVDPDKLEQVYYDVDDMRKFSLLVDLLKNESSGLAMVFCNTRRNTDFVAKNLKINGIRAMAIHGGFSQEMRTRTMNEFHSGSIRVLVCTDVAARGLDIKGVSHIYNYDIPGESKDYVHRIGRTARAGGEGIVINILTPRDWESFRRITRDNELDVDKEEMYDVPRAVIGWKEPPRNGARGFHRPLRDMSYSRPHRGGNGYRNSHRR